jgi:hypothetical protein
MKSFRLLGHSLMLLALGACADNSAVADLAGPSFAKGGGSTTPVVAPNLAGHWVQSGVVRSVLPSYQQEVWYEFDVTQSGSTLSGVVRRYVSYWDLSGHPTVVRRDLGSPGKVNGNAGSTPITIGFIKVNEGKQTFGFSLSASADLNTLTVLGTSSSGVTGFVRQ